MIFKDHIVRVENIKTMQMLDKAKLDHQVIAMFMTCEGIPLKTRALLQAKMEHFEDSELPCPAAY